MTSTAPRLAPCCAYPARERSGAVNRNLKRGADLAHAFHAEDPYPFDEHGDRNALDRIQIDRASSRNRIVAGFEDDLTRQTSNRRCARSNQGPSQSRDCDVTRQHHDRSASNFGKLAPPDLPSPGGHVAAAAERNDARSPHSSGSSRGCFPYSSTYAASISTARWRANNAVSAASMSTASVDDPGSERARVRRSSSTVVLILVRLMPRSCHDHASLKENRPEASPARRAVSSARSESFISQASAASSATTASSIRPQRRSRSLRTDQ